MRILLKSQKYAFSDSHYHPHQICSDPPDRQAPLMCHKTLKIHTCRICAYTALIVDPRSLNQLEPSATIIDQAYVGQLSFASP
jgi:hypothetical protein